MKRAPCQTKGNNISELKSRLSKFRKFYSRMAFFAQYYSKKLFLKIKRRAPSLKKLHIDSFPAIHLKRMDWMDFVLKFSGEMLVVVLSLCVAGLNVFYFMGSNAANYQDQSLASSFLSNHSTLNPKLYARNSSIVTVVAGGGIFPQAEASGLTGLESQVVSGSDGSSTPDDGTGTDNSNMLGDSQGILAPSPDSIKAMVVNVTKKVYTTQAGDTLNSIAAANNISVNSIIWSNPQLVGTNLEPGWTLIIPPINGVAVTADSNTTLPDLAAQYSPERYNPSSSVRDAAAEQLLDNIISYNGLDSAEDINPGDFLIIPGGVVATPPPAPTPRPKAKSSSGSYVPDNTVTSVGSGYDGVNHLFPVGYCTYYVATQMKITFGGNARNWLANAKASGYVTGQEPATHSAVVFSGSGYGRYGHVAYVEAIKDGAILVSEMNFDHFDRIDERWVSTSDPHIRGYIYP